MIESHLISWHGMEDSIVEIACFTWNVNVNVSLWNMTIACALRWGVASVGHFSTRRSSPYMRKHFRRRRYTSERHSFEATIVKKANMWL